VKDQGAIYEETDVDDTRGAYEDLQRRRNDADDTQATYEGLQADDAQGNYEGLQRRRDDQGQAPVYQRLASNPARKSVYPPPNTNRPKAVPRKWLSAQAFATFSIRKRFFYFSFPFLLFFFT